MMAPEASPEEQIAIAARMLGAFAAQAPTPRAVPQPRQSVLPASVLGSNHHQLPRSQDALAPVSLSPEESAGDGSDDATFRR